MCVSGKFVLSHTRARRENEMIFAQHIVSIDNFDEKEEEEETKTNGKNSVLNQQHLDKITTFFYILQVISIFVINYRLSKPILQ